MPDESEDFWKDAFDWDEVQILIRTGHDDDRLGALRTVASYGQPLPELVQPILDCLDNRDVRIRAAACKALGRFEPFATEIVPHLRRFTLKTDAPEFAPAVESLGSLGRSDASEVLSILVPMLGHSEGLIRKIALCGLHAMGAAAEPAIPALISKLSDNWSEYKGGWWEGYTNGSLAGVILDRLRRSPSR